MKTKAGAMLTAVNDLAAWCEELRWGIEQEIHHHGDEDSERDGKLRMKAIRRDITAAQSLAKQADRWQKVADELAGAVDSLLTQVDQMEGMFDDEDGAIADAVEAGIDAIASIRKLRKGVRA